MQHDWSRVEERLKTLINRWEQLPAESNWFALSQLRYLLQRYEEGERSDELYNEIMSFKL